MSSWPRSVPGLPTTLQPTPNRPQSKKQDVTDRSDMAGIAPLKGLTDLLPLEVALEAKKAVCQGLPRRGTTAATGLGPRLGCPIGYVEE